MKKIIRLLRNTKNLIAFRDILPWLKNAYKCAIFINGIFLFFPQNKAYNRRNSLTMIEGWGNLMQLKELLGEITYECIRGNEDVTISHLIYDSRNMKPNSVFICIESKNFDGHNMICEVIRKGAKAIVLSKSAFIPKEFGITVIMVEDTRKSLAYMSAAFFGYPARKMHVIGITGTKGKTTTTYIIKKMLETAGYKVGLIGTIEIVIGNLSIASENTTPESYLVQQYFSQMLEAGCDIVVMEVSSQGIMMYRTEGISFDIGVFTNLEPDHIGKDEHKDMNEYMFYKGKLFRQCKLGIVNIDDKHTDTVLNGHTCRLETYGFSPEADFRVGNTRLLYTPENMGVNFSINGFVKMDVSIGIPGKFNIYNAIAAIAVCSHYQVNKEQAQRALKDVQVKGRIELIPISKEFTLMIDYAHNAMSLENLLVTLREYNPKRLVCLFGCGGNRSKIRRYEMGEVSGNLADLTIITSDNPRYEEPQEIINDIKIGTRKTEGTFVEIIDRKKAIAFAIHNAKPGDIIVLAGKGHEDYQEIRGIKYPMDERKIIQDILAER